MANRPLTESSQWTLPDAFDQWVLATTDIDQFCSSSYWIRPAAAQLMDGGTPWLVEGESGGFAGCLRERSGGNVIEPWELSWALGCPLVGQPVTVFAEQLTELCGDQAVQAVVISGLVNESPRFTELVGALHRHFRLGRGPMTRRHRASLDGGTEGFLSRRSRTFRKNLRKAEQTASENGISFQLIRAATADEFPALFERMLAVDRRSWKYAQEVGLALPDFANFYRDMGGLLSRDNLLRVVFARQSDRDIGFTLGAVFGQTYRGLQFSFDNDFRHLSVGNLMQWAQIRALCQTEPNITLYDLGTGGDYKKQWSEIDFDTTILVASKT